MARIIVTKKRTLIDAEILATSEAAAKLQGYPHRKSRCQIAHNRDCVSAGSSNVATILLKHLNITCITSSGGGALAFLFLDGS
jgi:hypothetical protein